MSSLALFGVCAAAVKVCVAATRKGVQRSIEGINWLAETGQRELALLEKQLAEKAAEASKAKEEDAEGEQYLTTGQARREYRRIFLKARKLAAQNPLLVQQKEAVAHFLAARHSVLGKFLTFEETSQLDAARYGKAATEKIIRQATQRFVNTNREIIIHGIQEAVAEAGFTRKRLDESHGGRHYLVMSNSSGKAVVAEISLSKSGDIQTNIDLTGYTDKSCHQVMDDIVARLRDRHILLEQTKAQDHYRLLGEILPRLRIRKKGRQAKAAATPAAPDENVQAATPVQRQRIKA